MDDDSDGDSSEIAVTFGMLRSDLVDMLSAIVVSSSGLEQILKNNTHLSATDVSLLATAIENYASMVTTFSLSGEITTGEINAGARKLYARMDLLKQTQIVREALRRSIAEDQKLTPAEKKKELCTEEPDPYLAEVYGEEYT